MTATRILPSNTDPKIVAQARCGKFTLTWGPLDQKVIDDGELNIVYHEIVSWSTALRILGDYGNGRR